MSLFAPAGGAIIGPRAIGQPPAAAGSALKPPLVYSTPGVYGFKAPADGSYVFRVWAAAGGGHGISAAKGGAGGFLKFTLALTKDDEVGIIVPRGGYKAGKAYNGADGGGCAVITINGVIKVVAGAGAGAANGAAGGDGGGTTGGNGTGSQAGSGGSQSAGGACGNGSTTTASYGGFLKGGDGPSETLGKQNSTGDDAAGIFYPALLGGGVGGWYNASGKGGGGGSGAFGGGAGGNDYGSGGGGASWTHADCTSVTNTQGSAGTPGGTSESGYVSGRGAGVAGDHGGHGLVLVNW